MTNCIGTLADRCLERYIQGNLPEHEAREFEEHFFDCPECLAQVQAMEAVTAGLARHPVKIAKAPIPWPVRAGVLVAIAATLLIGIVSFRTFLPKAAQPAVAVSSKPGPVSPQPVTSPQLASPSSVSNAPAQLADLTLPAFRAPSLRGESENLHFEAGMKAYAAQDCQGAQKALSQVAPQDEEALAAQFYTGVCQMHDGELAAAQATLRKVDAAGDSPEQEAALYYLAQVALARQDSAAARHYLARTISLHGDFEQRARVELNKVK
jgi:TolA-binding protein